MSENTLMTFKLMIYIAYVKYDSLSRLSNMKWNVTKFVKYWNYVLNITIHKTGACLTKYLKIFESSYV